MARFDTIVTHEKPHLDEICAIWLLRKFGEEKFPGISTAKVIFWSTGGKIPDGRSAKDCEQDGMLLIGIGGGRFDEHPAVNGEAKEDECTATLVAKELEVAGDPSLKKILKFVVTIDLKGAQQPFDLASLTKALHQTTEPLKVIEVVTMELEAKYYEQSQFFTAKQELEQAAETEEIQGPGGRKLKMVTIVSDNPEVSKSARADGAAIIIQKQSSGNVQIFTNKKFGLRLTDIAQMLRLEEQKAKGRIVTTDWKILASEGKVEGVEKWYFHQTGQMLLNGSLTAKDVPPTKLGLDKIKEIIRIGINPSAFPEHCDAHTCIFRKCDWYPWGLHRCRKIRFEMKNSK